MPSLNHGYLCSRRLRQLFENQSIEALTDLKIVKSPLVHLFQRGGTQMGEILNLAADYFNSSRIKGLFLTFN